MSVLQKMCGVLVVLSLLTPSLTVAQTADELQQQISEHNAQIAALDQEIAQYQKQLDATSNAKQTLQNTISQLNLSIKKTTASIKLTQNKISTTQLQIQQLAHTIDNKQQSIEANLAGIAESMRQADVLETRSLAESLLSSESLSTAWEDVDASVTLRHAIKDNVDQLAKEKQSLSDTKTATEKKKVELLAQQRTLVSQQGSLNATKAAQNDLLKQTKAQESNFQNILTEKRAAKASFEQALNNLQTKLEYIVDPSKILAAGKGILQWPLDNVRITQKFGNTAFAQSGAYNGKGHNGIDLAASIGTPIKAALTGEVIGTGNTDATKGCYSFGKWVMLKHGNGLNTLYAHLSQIGVQSGQVLSTGEVLGYSGETGYATGPHLHFGVYVSDATQILKLGDATKSKTPCANAVMPVAPLSGYLNPLDYL